MARMKIHPHRSKVRWSEEMCTVALKQHYEHPWMTWPQFHPATGRTDEADRSFDLFAFHPLPSSGYARHVVEIKIHRDDFTKEIRNPIKRRLGLRWATQFYFAVPELLVRPEEVPPECGLYEIRINSAGIYECNVKVKAPELAGTLPTWSFCAAFVRRLEFGGWKHDGVAQSDRT